MSVFGQNLLNMKIRQSFVSNSSSSSFVVRYRYNDYTGEKDKQITCLTNEQRHLLKKNGFKYTITRSPCFVDTGADKTFNSLKEFKRWDDIYMAKSVSCNQDEVIYLLVTNKIPFVGLCHYDEELVVWDGNCKWFWQFPNIVEAFSRNIGKQTFNQGDWIDQLFEYNGGVALRVKRIKINEWVDNEAHYM